MSKRRTDVVGNPMMVNLPSLEVYENTGEGGMAFFLGVTVKEFEDRRNISCEGSIIWHQPDVCFNDNWNKNVKADAIMLIGSTGLSLFNGDQYFKATYEDLTEKGKILHNLIKEIYGEVEIITLLDT